MDYDQFEPAPKAAPLPAVAAPAPAPSTPLAPEDAPRFVGGRMRVLEIPLDFPVAFRGRVFEAITLRRPTAAEVGAWFERLAEATVSDPAATLLLPVFVDEAGEPIPREVFEFLDPDDEERLMEPLADFLPLRLRRMLDAAAASRPSAGVDTAPKS